MTRSRPFRTPPCFDAVRQDAADLRTGQMSRREFLSRATALGLSAGAAYGLIGLPAPAQTAPPRQDGGTLRIQQVVRPLGDPRSYDWAEKGNQTRGFLEYLVEYRRDGVFEPMLLESWETDATATRYTLRIRPDVTWNDGQPFTAADVAHNIDRWCDTTLPDNAMASRFPGLIDPDTGRARQGAIATPDDRTVVLSLSAPDVTLVASMADYPAAIVPRSYDGGDPFAHGVGTGPYRPVSLEPGVMAVLERHPDHNWWGSAVLGGPYLDRIEFIDLGTDPLSWARAAEASTVDMLYESLGDFVDVMDTLGWVRSEIDTAATVVVRPNARAEFDGFAPYAEVRVRQALTLAVRNAVCLELGYNDQGTLGENHHAAPIHPDYADIGPPATDPAAARALIAETGLEGFEHELIAPDEEWLALTAAAVVAQLNDAGIAAKRTILPVSAYAPGWRDHPFSVTAWNHRPLAVQTMALAYASDGAWNETGFSDVGFDEALARARAIAAPQERRAAMADMQRILQSQGVIIQPYWRRLFSHQNGRLAGAEKHPMHEIHPHRIGFLA